jgi:hypothetical protein
MKNSKISKPFTFYRVQKILDGVLVEIPSFFVVLFFILFSSLRHQIDGFLKNNCFEQIKKCCKPGKKAHKNWPFSNSPVAFGRTWMLVSNCLSANSTNAHHLFSMIHSNFGMTLSSNSETRVNCNHAEQRAGVNAIKIRHFDMAI